VSTPGSASYHHYLAKGQFGPMFGATASTVAAVTRQLSAAGLVPGPLGADGVTIPVTTTIAQAKQAFGTDFAGYALADGSTAYANTSAPLVPSAVTGVVGLNDLVHLTAAHHAAQPRGPDRAGEYAITGGATGVRHSRRVRRDPGPVRAEQSVRHDGLLGAGHAVRRFGIRHRRAVHPLRQHR